MTVSDVPAGWYPDPADNGISQRYWDGRDWTDQTRSQGQSGSSGEPTATATATAPDEDEERIPAGWYPDPDTDGATARYWDGDDWTERTRATLRPTPGSPGGRKSTSGASGRREEVTPSGPEPVAAPAEVSAPAQGPASPLPQAEDSADDAPAEQLSQDSDADEIPAGWYPDPDDGGVSERYWDGRDWTERTRTYLRPSPGVASQPAPIAPPPITAATPEPGPEQEPATAGPAEAEPERTQEDHVAEPAEQPAEQPAVQAPAEVEEPAEGAQKPDTEPAEVAAQADAEQPDAEQPDTEPAEDAEQGDAAEPVEVEAPAAAAEPAEPTASDTETESSGPGPTQGEPSSSSADTAAPTEGQPEAPTETSRVHAADGGRSNGHPAAPRGGAGSQGSMGSVPEAPSMPRPGPASLSSAVSAPTSSAQRAGFRPLQRLRGLRRNAEPAVRSSEAQWTVDTEAVDAFRQLEYNRLELLLGAVWGKAMEGDVASVQAATRLIEMRCRLMGVDAGSSPPEQAMPMLVGREERSRDG